MPCTGVAEFQLIPAAFRYFWHYLPILKDRWQIMKMHARRQFFGPLGAARWEADDISLFEHVRVRDPTPDKALLADVIKSHKICFRSCPGWHPYAAARFPVADVYLSQFFHSDATVNTLTAVANFSHCAVADDDIAGARVATDPAKQAEMWASAQAKIMREVCAVPVVQSLQLRAWNDSLDLGTEVNGSLNLSPPATEQAFFKD